MRFSIATVFSALVALAAATQPDYTKNPSGNAIIAPGLNEIVPEGKTYTIKWTPTTAGPISLVLLRGPSNNVQPLKTLAESIPNNGEFKWTPGSDLEADVTHYGLLLVVEGTGQYQYSTQFGISAAPGSEKSSTKTTESKTSAPETTASTSSTVVESTVITTTICPETQSASATTTAKITPTGVSPVGPPSSRPWTSIPLTTTAAGPTGTSSATPSTSSPAFNGAGRNAISFGAVMAGVIAAFAL
ncbi:Cell wall beta-glucan synthesis [Penicillium cf. griseofulvum]|uniref:Cell wall beta-glucan synthesis n=1 Tax=Penicillium cf. griseofulvum TaxID=2972120 RepID=A0A9W9J0B8_9EURO|nr:Cell wall beta-glucan synthesis [Penicillium cf. griseofulvum]KAJ5429937.1 Cell wall beta-glucan synthesis [Penicillium cf. griseofulvum]KAJ5436289.1 Cell wall beta-glucan synthesis [Penicillium cf. griseofulvum]